EALVLADLSQAQLKGNQLAAAHQSAPSVRRDRSQKLAIVPHSPRP
ncbi:MAG: hypothetical protein HC860_26330, partial [Alkalinema sp. RU_4_3]|nr:hypothetical protein [Alkalinema sp. RU_4_3]